MRVKGLRKAPSVSAQSARRSPEEVRITLHAPQALPASFRPSTAPRPALLRQKGLFCPQRPPRPPLKAAQTPLFGLVMPGFCLAAPGKRRSGPRFCPGPRHLQGPQLPGKSPECADFASAITFFRRRQPTFSRRTPRRKPCFRRETARQGRRLRLLPPSAARRPARTPRQGHPWAEQPRLPWSAFLLRRGEVCTPRGDQIPGHDG